MLTPVDLQQKKFQHGMGYTKKDVDSFFDIVVMSYTELYKSNAELTNQVKTLTDSLVHYRTTESKLQKSLMLAEKNAEEATKNANDKANDLQTKLDNHHFVLTDELENTISSDSTTTAPTANAVKIVNDKLDSHTNNHDNPHNVTKEQVGLGNNDNTADIDKPVSTAQQKAIDDAYANSNKYTDKKIAELISLRQIFDVSSLFCTERGTC